MRRWAAFLTVGAGAVSAGTAGPCCSSSNCTFDATCTLEDAGDAAVTADGRIGDAGLDVERRDGDTDAQLRDAPVQDAVTPDGPVDAPQDTFVCDPSKTPAEEPCVISETYGVFVAPATSGGSDTVGTGSRERPYATITKALANLGGVSRVYVCNGAYTDQITVTGAVGIFGGLTCGSASDAGTSGPWVYATGTKATVTGTTPAFALEINAGIAGVDVEDLAFVAPTAASGARVAARGAPRRGRGRTESPRPCCC